VTRPLDFVLCSFSTDVPLLGILIHL
jgi:hypothetical protein